MMSLNCEDCNANCCKNIPLDGEIPNHNGICLFLDVDNKCSIYVDRPLICKVDEGFGIYGEGYTLEEWYELNKKACDELKNV